MERDDNFQTLAKVLTGTLPQDLVDRYETGIQSEDFIARLKTHMGNWYNEHMGDVSLTDIETIVLYSIEHSMDISVNAEQAYEKYVEFRRNTKKNWLNKIKKEYEQIKQGQESSGFLALDANSYFSLKNMNGPVSGSYSNRTEYIENRYKEVQQWQKNKSSSLICFTYFDVLKPAQKVNAITAEVGLFCFECIMTQMYGNLEGGLFTSVPSSVFQKAFFSYQQNTYEQIGIDYKDGIVTIYNDYSPEGENSIIRTAFKSFKMSEEEARDSAIVRSLQNKYKLSDKAKSLDPVDLQILSTICSNINASVLASGIMNISLKSLARQFFKKNTGIRGRDYLFLIRRVNKLAEYTLSATVLDEHTRVVEKIILHFLDVHFQIPTNANNGTRNIDREIREALDDKNDDLEDVSMDISETLLQIIPGKTISDAWKEDTFQRIYSKTYASIEDAKTKLFLTIMETERLRIYPKTSEVLDISFFTNRLRFNMTASKTRSAVNDGLANLTDRGIVISGFEFLDNSHIKINYVPINETEKIVYKIEE